MSNFFRGDLKLKEKWWHRLAVVVFFVAFIIALIATFDSYQIRYKNKGLLTDRMDTTLRPLNSLVQKNERIDVYENNVRNDRWYQSNGGYLLKELEIYCAEDINNHIEEISKKTGISYFKGNGGKELVSLEVFKNYLISNNASCVDIFYLQPLESKVIGWGLEVGPDMKIWEISVAKSIGYLVLKIISVILAFGLIAVFYYKGFLYIVFGNNKKP